jgi:hypothetical protein
MSPTQYGAPAPANSSNVVVNIKIDKEDDWKKANMTAVLQRVKDLVTKSHGNNFNGSITVNLNFNGGNQTFVFQSINIMNPINLNGGQFGSYDASRPSPTSASKSTTTPCTSSHPPSPTPTNRPGDRGRLDIGEEIRRAINIRASYRGSGGLSDATRKGPLGAVTGAANGVIRGVFGLLNINGLVDAAVSLVSGASLTVEACWKLCAMVCGVPVEVVAKAFLDNGVTDDTPFAADNVIKAINNIAYDGPPQVLSILTGVVIQLLESLRSN